jgi:ribosomal protein S18 acetylase RimI-like enzyme
MVYSPQLHAARRVPARVVNSGGALNEDTARTGPPTLVQSRAEAQAAAQFLQECHGGAWRREYYHIGDLWWYLALNPAGQIGLWHSPGGAIAGLAWLEPPDGVVMQIRPDLRGRGDLEPAMLAWAAALQPAEMQWTRAFASDGATVAWLQANGFVAEREPMLMHRRDMAELVAAAPAQPGISVRAVRQHELQERVEAHRDAFEPSRFTLEKYLVARGAPDYNPELDIVAADESGTIGAYCISWYDAANRIGYFEPVGTRKAFRGRRLGQAVLNEALRRLAALGARESIVATNATNQPARRLYASVGFAQVDEEQSFGRRTAH